jgi:hypothetical protein
MTKPKLSISQKSYEKLKAKFLEILKNYKMTTNEYIKKEEEQKY